MPLWDDAQRIIKNAISAALPDAAVRRALEGIDLSGHKSVILVAIGKAAWQMGRTAKESMGERLGGGVVITKHDHALGDIPGIAVFEAGHPVPDNDTITATEHALAAVADLTPDDVVLFLVSGGGSALFEAPLIPLEDLVDLTGQLLKSGADITEMNTVRKRLSRVKGGKFAALVAPAKVYAIVLSDILGDPLDMIASGPAHPDTSTCADAVAVINKYAITVSPQTLEALKTETPKVLSNVETIVTGSVRQLCQSAEKTCRALGYTPHVLTSSLRCEASEAGSCLASIAEHWQDTQQSLAFIAGGETVVHLKGTGKGGRNQELALAAAQTLGKCRDTCVFSFGSDGTDGPTDAAGGYVDEHTMLRLNVQGVDCWAQALGNNDAYHALKAVDGLIMTGPTGTNVNDLSVVLIRR